LLVRLGEVLAGLAPVGAAHERRIPVDPLLGVAVEVAVVVGDAERRDRGLLLGVAQLGVGRELTDDGGDVVQSHVNSRLWYAGHRWCSATWLRPRRPRRVSPAYPGSGRGSRFVGRPGQLARAAVAAGASIEVTAGSRAPEWIASAMTRSCWRQRWRSITTQCS